MDGLSIRPRYRIDFQRIGFSNKLNPYVEFFVAGSERVTTLSPEMIARRFIVEWITVWNQLSDVFDSLSQQLSMSWDLAAGNVQSRGWQDLLKYRELIDRIPEIRQLIEELGRLQASEEDDDTDPTCADLFNSLRRTTEELREVEHPLARHQAQGIDRSEISSA